MNFDPIKHLEICFLDILDFEILKNILELLPTLDICLTF